MLICYRGTYGRTTAEKTCLLSHPDTRSVRLFVMYFLSRNFGFTVKLFSLFSELLTLVTEKPPPALLTVTLPRLLAGPMEAAWVTDAVITVATFEPHSTPVNQYYISLSSCGKLCHIPYKVFSEYNNCVFFIWDSVLTDKLTCTPLASHKSHVLHHILAGR